MLSKIEKRLEKARADLKASRGLARQWRYIAGVYRARARTLETGLAVIADTSQGWAEGSAEEIAEKAARVARLSLASAKKGRDD